MEPIWVSPLYTEFCGEILVKGVGGGGDDRKDDFQATIGICDSGGHGERTFWS